MHRFYLNFKQERARVDLDTTHGVIQPGVHSSLPTRITLRINESVGAKRSNSLPLFYVIAVAAWMSEGGGAGNTPANPERITPGGPAKEIIRIGIGITQAGKIFKVAALNVRSRTFLSVITCMISVTSQAPLPAVF